ncbi:hypothetical protein AK37_18888 [Rhodococcus pyridinivorans AK37]|uniref:Glucose/Sorbosone dehydrogenase domain-containing protein n=1 Tax=Rhodococcus pyridinivorans AK37 TaxID=1114960 RepID=H0JVR4_9NOCA|nr:hypothetical protein AK37_18888 [Rhodococcus pyridinivorans AK37]
MSRTLLAGLAAAATAVYLGACASPSSPSVDEGTARVSRTVTEPSTPGTGTPRVTGTVASGLDTPWGVAFLPGGSALVNERNTGRIVEITDGEVREVGRVGETLAQGESGLLGIAVSPTFDTDRFVYLYVTTGSDNRVLRAVFDGTTLAEPEVILDGIPAGRIHDGGRMIFGPDGMLYVATGEAGERELAQDPESLGGKILRITGDGEPAPDNPDPASPVYSLGHRNVQGLAFDDRGRLWASEFGQNDVDELNLVTAGANYGWPVTEGPGAPANSSIRSSPGRSRRRRRRAWHGSTAACGWQACAENASGASISRILMCRTPQSPRPTSSSASTDDCGPSSPRRTAHCG